jgi:hypothetical protein
MVNSDRVVDKLNTVLTIAGSVFFTSHKSLRVEEALVWATPNLIDDIRFQIDVK